jgi:hypothetical protein
MKPLADDDMAPQTQAAVLVRAVLAAIELGGDDMKLTKRERTGLILAALPFVVTVGDSAAVTVNGVTTVRWDYNYAGVVLGLIALLVVYMGMRDLNASIAYKPEPPAPHYAVFAAIGLLAIYQIAKGAFLI